MLLDSFFLKQTNIQIEKLNNNEESIDIFLPVWVIKHIGALMKD
jgi:hypothetical protein